MAYEKLIRDRIVAVAQAEGRQLPVRRARAGEMQLLLSRKLIEESIEVAGALGADAHDALVEELADVQAVVEAIASHRGIDLREVAAVADRKRQIRGGFAEGLVLTQPISPQGRLHVGGSASLVDAIRHELQNCTAAGFAVAFVMQSGLDLLEGALRAALLRGANIRFLTTDYLDVTEPDALERMLGWAGRFEARVFSHPDRSFHPKAYWFERPDGSGRAFIGSANFSRMGLREGIEWTWSVLDLDPGFPIAEIRQRFDEFFLHAHAHALSPAWLQAYRERRRAPKWRDRDTKATIQPRPVQSLALREIERLRADGETRALVIAATGLGKTFLAAFDAAAADRVLFIAHREELLQQASRAFAALYPGRSQGFVAAARDGIDRDVVFASVQTLSQASWLSHPQLHRFDYVVVDEFHHAAADSYTRLLNVLQPRFLLGLTATPWRGDNRDLMALCHGNVAYEVGLFDAMAYGWLVPFRYFGVADVVTYQPDMLTRSGTYDASRLTLAFNTPQRAALALKHFRAHTSQAALGFCVSIDHAEFMADAFRQAGVAAAAVHSGSGSMPRDEAIDALTTGRLRVLFTVDLFNEGVDIPCIDLVMFLRPTESMVVFLQQLGRGLRLHDDKNFLTVLDFLGNYRRAHFKLPFLVGIHAQDAASANAALLKLEQSRISGQPPAGLPDGIHVELEPLALNALRESLRSASPLRELVLADLRELSTRLARMPTLLEVHQLGRYGPRTCKRALGKRRWIAVARSLQLATSEELAIDEQAGDFLEEVEGTSMTKSFKMIVLKAMLEVDGFTGGITMPQLIAYFRRHFAHERYRLDVNGTVVESASATDDTWRRYLASNPINAWIGGNAATPSRFFAFDAGTDTFRYIGPTPDDKRAFEEAVRQRVDWRIEDMVSRSTPGRFVFNVIPSGSSSDRLCVMFGQGAARQGLPSGWHPVRINGRFFYGKFVAVALNVLKDQPDDGDASRNVLSSELRHLLGMRDDEPVARTHRVRFVPLPTESAWAIEAA